MSSHVDVASTEVTAGIRATLNSDAPAALPDVVPATAHAPVPAQTWNREQLDLLKRTICEGSTDDEFDLFVNVCKRTGLDPFQGQIHAVKRNTFNKRSGQWEDRMGIQTGIDGLRLIARRTDEFRARFGPYLCGEDGEWQIGAEGRPKPWLAVEPPKAALCGVLRAGDTEPTWAVARWDSYVQTTKKDGKVVPNRMWATMPDLMLGKCLPYKATIETDRGPIEIGRIVRARLPVKVRSIDLTTGLEDWCEVVGWFRNGATDRWVRLWVPNNTHGNRCLRLTEDHPVWTEHGWMKAGEVEVGTRVAVTSPTLTAEQRQVILGGLLGDGTLSGRKSGANLPHYAEGHSIAQSDYLRWKGAALANLGVSFHASGKTDGAGGVHPTLSIRTRSCAALAEFRSMTPIERLSELDDFGLAVWFMDDGSIKPTGGASGSIGLSIHCCGFGAEFAEAAAAWFASRYGVEARVLRRHKNPYLAIGVEGTRTILDRVSAYVIPDGTRKKWIAPPVVVGPTAGFVFMPVQQVELRHGGQAEGRYDIEVEGTHTFVYNNVVVSNCSEALALRSAFPNEMAGLYTADEMGQADNDAPVAATSPALPVSAEPSEASSDATMRDKAWWRERGWIAVEQHDAVRKGLVDRFAKLPETGKAAVRAWMEKRDVTFTDPQPKLAFENLAVEIDRAEKGDPATDAQAPAGGSAPEGAADTDAGQQAPAGAAEAGSGDEVPCPLCLRRSGQDKTVDAECWGCSGTGFRPVFHAVSNDGDKVCELCGSVRAARVDVDGVHRCSDANGCRDRVAKSAEQADA